MTMEDDPQAPELEASYSEVRRWCILNGERLTPGKLQTAFRIGYSRAAQLLEELERDLVLRRRQDGSYTSFPAEHAARRAARNSRAPFDACELCGWHLPPALRNRSRRSCVHSHHITPIAAGGLDTPENRVLLCPNHHALAHALFTIPRGRPQTYRGPSTRAALLEALRLAEADPSAYWLDRSRPATNRLRDALRPDWIPENQDAARPTAAPSPPLAPAEASPAPPRLLSLANVTAAMVRYHLTNRHRGPIFDCHACATHPR